MEIKLVAGGIVAFVLNAIRAIARLIIEHKDIVSAIVLRVERDTADGDWTNEEKEQEAVDIYNNQFKPKLSWELKALLMLVPDRVIESWIRKMIESICKQSKKATVTQ